MPKRQDKPAKLVLDLTQSSLHLLKRAQLQQYCKKLGLRGAGKNTELIQRLQDHFKQAGSSGQKSPLTPPPDTQDVTLEEQAAGLLPAGSYHQLIVGNDRMARIVSSSYRDQTTPLGCKHFCCRGGCGYLEGGRGWCVIHGQELVIGHWYPLSLRCGRACVSRSGSYIPLHLVPSSTPTPPGLTDNLICEECMGRNQEKDDRLQQKSSLQDKSCPNSSLQKSGTVGSSRIRNKSGRFQPQEDPEYARRVDELLDQMASGQVDYQKVLQPIRPAVIHSPLGKQESSPIPINPMRD